MKMMTHVRRIPILTLVCALLIVEAGCDDEREQLPPGTTEPQVVELLGRPSAVYTERKAIEGKLLLPDDQKNCVPTVVRVLFYRRRIRPSVAVGIDVKDRVVCVERYAYDEIDVTWIQRR